MPLTDISAAGISEAFNRVFAWVYGLYAGFDYTGADTCAYHAFETSVSKLQAASRP
ncbi:MAG: hypothetical protein LBB22_05090 [Treponema sp.]|nr:hypothetical protein [Treponema sp.]